jgi:hypothetical protein
MDDIVADFQNLMSYCANDVEATYRVYCEVLGFLGDGCCYTNFIISSELQSVPVRLSATRDTCWHARNGSLFSTRERGFSWVVFFLLRFSLWLSELEHVLGASTSDV